MHRLESGCFRAAIEACEYFADGQATLEELEKAQRIVDDAIANIPNPNVDPPSEHFVDDENAYFLALFPADAILLACANPGVSNPSVERFAIGKYLFWVVQVVGNVARTSGKAIHKHTILPVSWILRSRMKWRQVNGEIVELKHLSDLLRDVIGNPFQRVQIEPAFDEISCA